MNEIKCPRCGEAFTIDEAGFAAILKQVRDAEFDKEVRRHEELLAADKRQAVQLAVSEALGKDVYHYHIHIVYTRVVEKQILWTKRYKDK